MDLPSSTADELRIIHFICENCDTLFLHPSTCSACCLFFQLPMPNEADAGMPCPICCERDRLQLDLPNESVELGACRGPSLRTRSGLCSMCSAALVFDQQDADPTDPDARPASSPDSTTADPCELNHDSSTMSTTSAADPATATAPLRILKKVVWLDHRDHVDEREQAIQQMRKLVDGLQLSGGARLRVWCAGVTLELVQPPTPAQSSSLAKTMGSLGSLLVHSVNGVWRLLVRSAGLKAPAERKRGRGMLVSQHTLQDELDTQPSASKRQKTSCNSPASN